jgi:ectoine hydroxylase-related dioxygenase (phytanoyl-CoA dioxygenase family)
MTIDILGDEYRTNGFVIVRGLFEADRLREIAAEVERVVYDAASTAEHGRVYFDDEGEAHPQRKASAVRCVFRIQEHSHYLRELLNSPQMTDLVRPLLGDEPVADGIQYIDKPPHAGYEFPYHQDNAYMLYEPPRALVATVALDRQLADSGPIAFLRGSHALEILPHQPSGVLGASRGLVDQPDKATYPEVIVEMEAGDLLVHHANVIHRTGPNHTPRHRRNLGFIYHGAGAMKDAEANAKYERELTRNAIQDRI